MPEVSTASVVADFLRYRIRSRGLDLEFDEYPSLPSEKVPDELHEAIINLTDKLTDKYRNSFNFMSHELNTSITEESISPTFAAVTNEMFVDGVISWGRITALFSFAGALCEWGLQKNISQSALLVEELMTAFIDEHLTSWIVENRGWDGLVDFYHEFPPSTCDQPSNGAWSGKQLVGVATLGLLTVGAFFFRS